jgi:hypothetical protein
VLHFKVEFANAKWKILEDCQPHIFRFLFEKAERGQAPSPT